MSEQSISVNSLQSLHANNKHDFTALNQKKLVVHRQLLATYHFLSDPRWYINFYFILLIVVTDSYLGHQFTSVLVYVDDVAILYHILYSYKQMLKSSFFLYWLWINLIPVT